MANLAIYGSHRINGVAKLHSQILKEGVFRDFYQLYPEKFTNVTNGVTQRRWLLHANPLLAAFISKRIGKEWITDFSQISKLASFATDRETQLEFLEIKKKNKQALIRFLERESFTRDANGKIITHSHILPSTALFDVQIKRIHEYKRQLMNVLHLIMIYQEAAPRKVSRFAIFAGKAAPGYERAKQVIQLICAMARKFHEREEVKENLCVAFIENYNISRAEIIIPAADLSEQISTAGWEASGTGNMKLTMNGALTIGTEDGANIEMHAAVTDRFWPFQFGASAEQYHDSYDPADIYTQDEQIRRALDTLVDGSLAESRFEEEAFSQLHRSLIEHDSFRVLKDLREYYETQKKVEELFLQPHLWAEMAIHNISAMGSFSTDQSIRNYAQTIWGIEPCPIDADILSQIRCHYLEG
jgi:starch phosphorylase